MRARTHGRPLTELSQEKREGRGKGLFSEYLSTRDWAEALLSAQELAMPDFLPTLAALGVERLLDVTSDGDRERLVELLVRLVVEGPLPGADLLAAVKAQTDQLGDLMCAFCPVLVCSVVGVRCAPCFVLLCSVLLLCQAMSLCAWRRGDISRQTIPRLKHEFCACG